MSDIVKPPISFMEDKEVSVCQDFAERGLLNFMQTEIAKLAALHLNIEAPENPLHFLDTIHLHVDARTLNDLRLSVIQGVRSFSWFRPAYYKLVKNALSLFVGNELAMQRGLGLSIQLPQDTSSLLPIHADVWDGDSAFEVVVWLPLVDCYETKAMYIVPMEEDREIQGKMSQYQYGSAEDLYEEIAPHAEFLKVGFGQVLIFSQTLMHGNRVNLENETRWSMNCRFKNLYAPYADKKLGEFFEPITMRPTSRIGADYTLPTGFSE